MTKYEFEAQHYYLKWFCSFPLIAVALFIEFIIAQHTESDIIFYSSCAIVIGGLMSVYYILFSKLSCFRYKGYYWEENDKIVIELGKKKYIIDEVNSVMGGEPNIFLYYYAYLQIKTPNKKIKIYGQALNGNMEFKNSDLYPLFRLILEKHKDLKPKKVLGATIEGSWYEK